MTLSSVLESPITERPFDSTVLDVKPRDSVYASLAAVLRSTHPVEYHRTPAGETILTAGCVVEKRIFPGQSEAWEMGFLKETASLLSLRKRGGISFSIFFDPGHGQRSWNCFAPIHISIPRCAYRQSADAAAVELSGDPALARALWETMQNASTPATDAPAEPLSLQVSGDEQSYASIVEQATRRMADGRLTKIVLADECIVTASREFDVARIAAALDRLYPTCHTFLISPSRPSPDARRVVFLGATPELLARVSGRRVSTMALAGTVAADTEAAPASGSDTPLHTDVKIDREHGIVVDMIERELGRICRNVSISERRIVDLPHVRHLCTMLEGDLADGRTLADAVACLHPTPAVCGTPRESALQAIRGLENMERGMYAGIAGWMNESGEGRAVVTLRSALLEGARARVFAGAGILPSSRPMLESAETRMKMRAVLAALEQG